METLLFHTKMAHKMRAFLSLKNLENKISIDDIKVGFKQFIIHNKIRIQIPI